MDKIVKNDSLCYQILFNKPLLKERGKYIYGFRIKYNELNHKPISSLSNVSSTFGYTHDER